MINFEGAESENVETLAASRTGSGESNRSNIMKRWLPLLVIAAIMLASYSFGLHHYLSLEGFTQNKEMLIAFISDHFWSAVAIYIGVYIFAVAISFPGASFLTIAGGIVFGWVAAGTMTIIGATIGATIIFLVARTAVGDLLKERAGPRLSKLHDGFNEDAFMYLLFLRLVPAFPFWLINLAPAFFGMRLVPYIVATAVGIIPGTYAYAYFGQSLGTAIDKEGHIVPHNLLLGLAVLAVATLIPIIIKRWRKSRHPGS